MVIKKFISERGSPVKSVMRAVDRFCMKHPGFGVPNLMMFIVIGNVAVWLFSMMDTTGLILDYLRFSPDLILRGQIWRLFTFVFTSGFSNGSIIWFAVALYFYYLIGNTLEQQWGRAKFNIYYFSGILLNIIYGFIVWAITGKSVSLTAMYSNLSMFFAFATMWPDTQFMLFFFIPLKSKWLAIIDAVFFIYEIVVLPFPLNLIPLVAVVNYFFFCGGWLLDYIRPAPSRAKQASRAVNFKRAAKKVQREQRNKPYNRKCEVCGRTDTDFPGLEFRYCSRCQGYHCFCEDHINNHEHFNE